MIFYKGGCMSWKMFFQIVLLIVIATVIMMSAKCAMWKCKGRVKGKAPICAVTPPAK